MNTTVIPYLSFQGNCEEAITAYTQAFGGKILYLSRWSKETCSGDFTKIGKVMHAEFLIGQTRMSAGDNPDSAPPNETVKFMIHTSSLEEAACAISVLQSVVYRLRTGSTVGYSFAGRRNACL